MLDSVEKICLKIILASEYDDYMEALEKCHLSSLRSRRQTRVDNFIIKSLKHEKHQNMFPISNKFLNNTHNLRHPEKFKENKAKTNAYRMSFIPYAQRRLNVLHNSGKL